MKISVEISEKEIKKIIKVSGERKMGPAIRKMALKACTLDDRDQFCNAVMGGDLTIDFEEPIGKWKDRVSWKP